MEDIRIMMFLYDELSLQYMLVFFISNFYLFYVRS
jgi:hypothetical protein